MTADAGQESPLDLAARRLDRAIREIRGALGESVE